MPADDDHTSSDATEPPVAAELLREHRLLELVEGLPEAFVLYDRTGRITFANADFRQRSQRSLAELVGRRPFEWDDGSFADTDDTRRFREHLDASLATGEDRDYTRTHQRPDGGIDKYRVSFRALHDDEGRVSGAYMFARDLRDVAEAQRDAQRREHQFHWLLDNLPDVVIRFDRDYRATYVNRRLHEHSAAPPTRIVGLRPSEIDTTSVAGIDDLGTIIERVIASGEPDQYELSFDDGGVQRSYSFLARAERDERGQIAGAFVLGRDITDLVRATRRAEEGERLFRSLAENATDFIGRWSPAGRQLYANPALARLLRGVDQTAPDHDDGDDTTVFAEVEAGIRQCVSEGAPVTVLQRVADPADASMLVHEVQLVPEFDDDGSLTSVLGIGRDISAVMRQRDELERIANTDSLTGVASRNVLYATLPGFIEGAIARGRSVAILLADLDGFKHLNDQYGHRFGDHVLRLVASEFGACIESCGTIIRLGGDEFVLVAEIESATDASLLARDAQQRLVELSSRHQDLPPLDVSVGIAMAPHDGDTVDALLAAADLALYSTKHARRGGVEFYRPDLRAVFERRRSLERALRDCVPDDEMTLNFQPICSLGNEMVMWGAEALLRWTHPELGTVTPDEFIPIAEQSGQIVPIGRWVLRQAAEVAVALNDVRTRPIRITVNVSTRQIMLTDLAAMVRDEIRSVGCDPSWLVLEITESLLLEDVPHVHRTLNELRSLGVAIAIDDFGTGYSALHYLSKLRIDHLKVDKTFVREADIDMQQQEVVRALVAMAHALGLGVIAEGIETEGQADLLRQLGCRLGQGYLLARPMPRESFEQWLRDVELSVT